ncbi:MAG: hypothetical protein QNJ75_08110 [Acidimicrobiia bacterium]|nr:hypothetical protein [Acidimicrobiia bacterium]
MDDENQYRTAIRLGLRRAGLHWIRAGYEMVAGLGAFLDEIVQARNDEDPVTDEDTAGQEGPVRIEID